ncbi:MAG: DUF5655 domain-containing protein [Pseudomonadales bacterium]|jgi:hypothetical protein|nr:DUF5655 domain-containing protein [Pseudomonadales bacterium]
MSDPAEQARTMIANLAEKTGRSREQWLALTVPSEYAKHGQLVKWLKSEHGVSHGFANLIAHETLAAREGAPAGGDLVEAQYAGAKADLKPVHDALVGAVAAFGDDVEFAPKKSYVSIRRRKQFALVQPSTKTRVDVGLNLPDTTPTERLETSGSFNAMVSHRVRLRAPEDVDDELVGWLRAAYDAAG